MSEEFTYLDKIFGTILLAFGGGLGVQRYQFARMEKEHDTLIEDMKKLKDNIRSRTDCADICMNFQKVHDRMSVIMSENFKEMRTEFREDMQRLYDKLEQKEDKHV